MLLSYDLSKRGGESKYVFLYRCIRDDILSGELGAGERLPSKRRLAEHLAVGLVTVESAYAQLVAEGYVEARERRGYFVARLPQAPLPAARFGDPQMQGERGLVATVGGAVDAVDCGLQATHGRGDVAAQVRPASAAQGRGVGCPTVEPLEHESSSLQDESAARLWGRSLRASLAHEPLAEVFGPVPWNGAPRLRQAIARYVQGIRGFSVDPGCVVVGAGAQVLYNFVVQLLGLDAHYAVEDPGYARLTSIYLANSCNLCYVPLDEAGVSMAALQESGASVVHLMPSHQFPTGRVTTVARRYELLSWANQQSGRYIVEDDYDCEFRLAGKPIPALASMDASGRVIYLGTFSKSLSSALRMAYAVLPPGLMERANHDFWFYSTTVSALDQVTLARMLANGDYERHVSRRRTRLRGVRDALLAALAPGIASDQLVVEEKDSGLHFVLGVRTAGKPPASFAGAGAAQTDPHNPESAKDSVGRGHVQAVEQRFRDVAEFEQAFAKAGRAAGLWVTSLSAYCHDVAVLPDDGLVRFVIQYDGLSEEQARYAGEALLGVLG